MKNEKGFSLVELIIAIALFAIVLSLGYQLFNYAQSNYVRTTNYWERQNKVIYLSRYIESTIDNADYMEVVSSTSPDYDPVEIASDFKSVIFTNEATFKIMTDDLENVETVLTDFRDEEFVNLLVSFNRVPQYDNVTFYSDLLEIVVTAEDINFTLKTKVKIENINEGDSIVGADTGDIIIFTNPVDLAN